MALEIDRARANLRSLDGDFQKRLLQVSRKQKVAYFTAGHDERSDAPGVHDPEAGERRSSVRALRAQLADQGFEVKDLGLAQGLGTDVPADASLVLVVGPAKPFLPEENVALQRYLDRNGRLLVALDPEAGLTFSELLSNLWLEYNPVPLAHDAYYYPLTRQISDRINIGAVSWSSHASVTTNSRMGDRGAVLLMGAGYLAKKEKAGTGIINVDVNLRTPKDTWADKNGDFNFNEGAEMRASYDLIASVTKRNASAVGPDEEARVVVMADSDLLTDRALRLNRGNQILVVDTFRWLAGEERFSGQVSSEEDMPVTHTRKEDLIWFYLSIFAVPALVVGLGFVMTAKRKKRTRAKLAPGRTGPGTPPSDKPSPPTSEVVP